MTKRISIEQVVLQSQLSSIQVYVSFVSMELLCAITSGYSFPVTMYAHASYALWLAYVNTCNFL